MYSFNVGGGTGIGLTFNEGSVYLWRSLSGYLRSCVNTWILMFCVHGNVLYYKWNIISIKIDYFGYVFR